MYFTMSASVERSAPAPASVAMSQFPTTRQLIVDDHVREKRGRERLGD